MANRAENLNICIITSWFPNKKQPYSGSFVYYFAKSLAKFGVKISLIVPLVEGEESVTSEDSMMIYRVKGKFPLFAMLQLVNQIMPDIIHVQAPNFFSSFGICVAKLKKIPIVATVHRAEVDKIGKPMHTIRKFVLGRFNKIIAVSEFSRSLALKAGADVNKISIIYNSCDETHFSQKDKFVTRKKYSLPVDK